tara:strand:+ start:12674 stop:13147 length:474 start_codon:yes stop_codon:yes gene_type:complete
MTSFDLLTYGGGHFPEMRSPFSRTSPTLSRNLSSLGSNLGLSTPKVDWMLGSSIGREIKAVIFTIDSTLDSLNLDWRIIHPETNEVEERILLDGTIESMKSGYPLKNVVTSGTLGYHEPLVLRFLKQNDDSFSTDAKSISEMLITIEYESDWELFER